MSNKPLFSYNFNWFCIHLWVFCKIIVWSCYAIQIISVTIDSTHILSSTPTWFSKSINKDNFPLYSWPTEHIPVLKCVMSWSLNTPGTRQVEKTRLIWFIHIFLPLLSTPTFTFSLQKYTFFFKNFKMFFRQIHEQNIKQVI